MAIQTQHPTTGEIIKTFEPHSDAYVDAAITELASEGLRAFCNVKTVSIA